MSTVESRPFGIRELASRVGVNENTIRCYEELGLLAPGSETSASAAAGYDEDDVRELLAALRVRELIGLPAETARGMVEAEQALEGVCERLEQSEDAERRAELVGDALGHVEQQLSLTRARRRQLDAFEAKLWAKRNGLKRFLHRADHADGQASASRA
jgi:DNA-binding transcriptional MerR regulator